MVAIHYQSLAEGMSQAGQQVTVVYFGAESILFDEMAKVYSEQGILNLVRYVCLFVFLRPVD
jgi:hypothetical protein